MTIYNKDVDKLYNDLISDYLNKGYVISPTLIGKHRRGITAVCITSIELFNPKIKDRAIRIFVDRDTEMVHCGNMHEYVEYVYIYAKQYNYTKEDRKNNKILWCDEGDLIFDKKYYCISNSNVYTETLDELAIIYMIRGARIKQKRELKQNDDSIKLINLSNLKPETIDSIMARINCMHGFKTATASCIQKIGVHKTSCYNYNLQHDVPRIEGIIYVDYKSKQTQIYLR